MIVFRAFLTQELPAAYTVHLAPEDRPAPTRVTVSDTTCTLRPPFPQPSLTNPPPTQDMRLWQMIVDSWTAAGGRPEALRHLAFHHIVNDAANAAISRAFDRRDAQPGQTVVITPDDGDMWATNPFARCGSAVARALRAATPGQRAVPVRAHLQCPAARDERAQVHMVVEFGSDEPASSPAPQPVEAVEEDVGNEPGFDLLSLAGPAQATAGPMGEPEDEQGFDLLSLKVRVRPQRGADMTTSSRESAGKNKRSREPGPDESRSRKRLNDGLNLKVHFDFDLRVW